MPVIGLILDDTLLIVIQESRALVCDDIQAAFHRYMVIYSHRTMNFWESTQLNKIINKSELNKINKLDKTVLQGDYYKLEIYAINTLYKFGKKMTNRQRVLSTAAVYLKRFYLENNYLETDLNLIIITCLYLSSKVEELPISIRVLSAESNKYFKMEYSQQSIGKMEFNLINDLDCQLIVHHPLIKQFNIEDSIKSLSHYILNDIYKTNIILQYQPYNITISIIIFAYSIQSKLNQPIQLLRDLNCDLSVVDEIIKQIYNFYSTLPNVVDDEIKLLYLNSHL